MVVVVFIGKKFIGYISVSFCLYHYLNLPSNNIVLAVNDLMYPEATSCCRCEYFVILSVIKGHKGDFPPNRLKSGSGEQCLWVLDRLADEALKSKNFSWKRFVSVVLSIQLLCK